VKAAKVGRIGTRREVIIPRGVLDELRLREGDLVEISTLGGSVSLTPRKASDPEDTVTPGEAKKLRLALQQLKDGKTRPWSQVKRELGL
jgi:antitoxin component of MazEF toxin-antitoxin module